ncbi:PEP-CTERM sorting domain-containing protein [Colwellia sp. E2M01]|uniref:PEP-CTERM sorting domain-containing protein n=1 Tax=Colwellia sp. E2M01 TaxID=2841561 RepID=UPI001C08B4FE|nr:PEP-CTERM sorting domain-containing protein [Colwellia sp. E2M01]MBU2869501.1 PEP-CTERM sorting domain-containing protein [Colwellia sp. E2M01]
MSSANAVAADFLVNTTIDDSGDKVNGSESIYGIDSMNISSVGDLITVDIYTNFVNSNNRYDANDGRIVFGDLLISTQGANSPFDYAFVLSDGRESNYSNNSKWNTKEKNKQGTLTEISSTITSKDYHGADSYTSSGEVMAGTAVGNGTEGDWSTTNYGRYTGLTDKISFSFNVNGIDAFQNASQLAFSWGMSCANDIVSGIANVTNPIKVPEPATALLMLLALGFMVSRRNKKSSYFSA